MDNGVYLCHILKVHSVLPHRWNQLSFSRWYWNRSILQLISSWWGRGSTCGYIRAMWDTSSAFNLSTHKENTGCCHGVTLSCWPYRQSHVSVCGGYSLHSGRTRLSQWSSFFLGWYPASYSSDALIFWWLPDSYKHVVILQYMAPVVWWVP